MAIKADVMAAAPWTAGRGPAADPAAAQADARFWEKVDKTPTCWLWQGVMSEGAPGHFIHQKRRIQVRRKAWETFHGPVPPGHRLWATCGVARCIRPAQGHLWAIKLGDPVPLPHGGRHHKAGASRLTWQEVLILHGLARLGYPNWRLQAIFGLSASTVQGVLSGYQGRWTWLTRFLPRLQRRRGRRPRTVSVGFPGQQRED